MYSILITKPEGVTLPFKGVESITVIKENEAGQATKGMFTLHGDGTVSKALTSAEWAKKNYSMDFWDTVCDAERKTYQAFHRARSAKIQVLGFMDIEIGYSTYPKDPSVGIVEGGVEEWWIESAPMPESMWEDFQEYLESLAEFNVEKILEGMSDEV